MHITTIPSSPSLRRRAAAVAAGLAVAIGSFAPSAQAIYVKAKTEPPDCTSSIANVVNDDPICEPTEQP